MSTTYYYDYSAMNANGTTLPSYTTGSYVRINDTPLYRLKIGSADVIHKYTVNTTTYTYGYTVTIYCTITWTQTKAAYDACHGTWDFSGYASYRYSIATSGFYDTGGKVTLGTAELIGYRPAAYTTLYWYTDSDTPSTCVLSALGYSGTGSTYSANNIYSPNVSSMYFSLTNTEDMQFRVNLTVNGSSIYYYGYIKPDTVSKIHTGDGSWSGSANGSNTTSSTYQVSTKTQDY